MEISAKVVADSISVKERRLTTLQLRYPRFIHAELMTHRVFSRSASSSRAIPVKKLIQRALADPAFFVEVGANEKGMQANKLVDAKTSVQFGLEWNDLAKIVSEYALRWSEVYGIHKQIVNRVMEPWHHISVVVTATEWENFFELRDHPDAQPEIRFLAKEIRKKMEESCPEPLQNDDWHLPYVGEQEVVTLGVEICRKMSVARCARVSYLTHDGKKPDPKADIELFDKLIVQKPAHASPCEHQATPLFAEENESWHRSNFVGWIQFRKFIEKGMLV